MNFVEGINPLYQDVTNLDLAQALTEVEIYLSSERIPTGSYPAGKLPKLASRILDIYLPTVIRAYDTTRYRKIIDYQKEVINGKAHYSVEADPMRAFMAYAWSYRNLEYYGVTARVLFIKESLGPNFLADYLYEPVEVDSRSTGSRMNGSGERAVASRRRISRLKPNLGGEYRPSTSPLNIVAQPPFNYDGFKSSGLRMAFRDIESRVINPIQEWPVSTARLPMYKLEEITGIPAEEIREILQRVGNEKVLDLPPDDKEQSSFLMEKDQMRAAMAFCITYDIYVGTGGESQDLGPILNETLQQIGDHPLAKEFHIDG